MQMKLSVISGWFRYIKYLYANSLKCEKARLRVLLRHPFDPATAFTSIGYASLHILKYLIYKTTTINCTVFIGIHPHGSVSLWKGDIMADLSPSKHVDRQLAQRQQWGLSAVARETTPFSRTLRSALRRLHPCV